MSGKLTLFLNVILGLPAKSQSDSVWTLSSSSQNTNTHELPDASHVEKFDSKSKAENAPGQANMSALMEAVMKSGILSNNSTCDAIKEETFQNEVSPRALTLSAPSKLKTVDDQCACILCGEMFVDCFSQEVARWMFKGASYFTIAPANSEANGLIVHTGCLTKSSLPSLEVGKAIKQVS
ncbi:hypothetical protein F2Q69_00001766 [Brassica cretica]|uniref:PCFS4-like zinc finger domain-containing protein n=1 Tax=Brassica cretica TaxID=69181 RepID=A0A8S9NR34_BRACR|nr:hypothetical protein F2Q69_00001766 [Brassica cretica]